MTNKSSHKEAYKQRKLIANIWEIKADVVLYLNNRSTTLNMVFVLTLLIGIITNYYVLSMHKDAVMNEDLSAFEFIFWKVILLILGNSLFLSFVWLNNRYLLNLKLLSDKRIEITTWGLIKNKTRIISPEEISSTIYKDGLSNLPSKPLVNAPYMIIYLKGRKKLLLDIQGDFPNGYLAIIEVFISNGKYL